MTYFLERIAAHILDDYGDRLEKQCLVFPNRRAGLYFLKYLSVKAGKPVWAPATKTINELFRMTSKLSVAEPETLIFDLYRVYREVNPNAEKFDDFYFWGEMIINDFDNVDKYLVDASSIFSNLADLKRIDKTFGELPEEQVKIVKQFWSNYNSGSLTRAKSDFIALWSVLNDLYIRFRESLSGKGLAYEGMIFRELAEKCSKNSVPDYKWDTFHFIGFNALNNCEKALLHALKNKSLARFYWDYDQSYITDNPDHSAGYFIRQNLKEFGNDMPADWNYITCLSSPGIETNRRIIDTSSDISQVKLIPGLLDGLKVAGDSIEATRTAIVLADESLLVPLLSTIPETVDDVNITMGYPLKFSPVYSLVKNILSLQQNCRTEESEVYFSHKDVFNVLRHGFFSDESNFKTGSLITELIKENNVWIPAGRLFINDAFRLIFRKIDDPLSLPSYIRSILELGYIAIDDESSDKKHNTGNDIRNEFIYRILLIINRIESAIVSGSIPLTTATFSRLLDKILRNISIPFTGEPLKGLQVMGILETRALDFSNVIITSVNEGTLPRSSAGTSYIPYNLREAFGLPTIRHQDSIYAYYFYRLLHRAEKVTFIYNSNSDGIKTGEMSRFLLQLNYLYKSPPVISGVSFEISAHDPDLSKIKRSEKHSEILSEKYLSKNPGVLSPSALNTWLSCRMRFYYKYVCGLKEPEAMITDIDPAVFGEILHSLMEKIYGLFIGRTIDIGIIESIHENEISEMAFQVISGKIHNGGRSEPAGNEQIISSIITSYAKQILRKDCERTPFTILELEKKTGIRMSIMIDEKETGIFTGGIIDRLDRKEGKLRIIDYKTGNVSMELKSVGSLFDENNEKRNEAWLQMLMYCEILKMSDENNNVIPVIYPVRSMTDKSFTGMLRIRDNGDYDLADYNSIRMEFREGLKTAIESIFRKDNDFIMTDHTSKCEYCPYRKLCRR